MKASCAERLSAMTLCVVTAFVIHSTGGVARAADTQRRLAAGEGRHGQNAAHSLRVRRRRRFGKSETDGLGGRDERFQISPIRRSPARHTLAELDAMDVRPSRDAYLTTLTSLVRGGGHLVSRQAAQALWDLGVPLQHLLRLVLDRNSQGSERFFADAIVTYMKEGGYTISDLVRVADLVDHAGQNILDSSNDFFDFFCMRGDIDEACRVAAVTDRQGRTLFSREPIPGAVRGCLEGGFEGIGSLLKLGGTARQMRDYVALADKDGGSFFRTPRDIIRFIEHGGTLDDARRLIVLKDHDGAHIFNEFSTGLLRASGISTDFAERIAAVKDTSERVVFSDGEQISDLFPDALDEHMDGTKRPTEAEREQQVRHFVSITDHAGQTVLRDGADVRAMILHGGTSDDVASYLGIRQGDSRYLRGDQIVLLLRNGLPPELAAQFAERGLNPETALHHFLLGLTAEQTDFANSGAPKAFSAAPVWDPADPIGLVKFADPASIEFSQRLRSAYDLKVRAFADVDALERELLDGPELDLLTLGGHGSPTSLTLGRHLPKYDVVIPEDKGQLTIDTPTLGRMVRRVKRGGAIFVDACFAGYGEDAEVNLANTIARAAPERTVIASTREFDARTVKINRLFPLDLSIFTLTGEPSTYVVRITD